MELASSATVVAVKRVGLLEGVDDESDGDSEGGFVAKFDLSAYMHVPLDSERFVWPSEVSIRDEQRRHREVAPAAADENGLVRVDGKLWVPREARDLLQRLLVVTHCGPQGHRGSDVMVTALNDRFAISNTKILDARFLRECLLCKHVKGGKLIQRPWGPTTTATQRNECLHMDYLELGESYGTSHYVLVLKDELTHYCELVAADSATSATAAAAVLDWHKRVGLPEVWESDNGSHFKAALMQQLAEWCRSLSPLY
ncbi:unnamed protein product [Phytophthora fragariaefolia]|uniref:Unnamed protein product n=1 Tax=Phytophthora fragariaefolia TaxID=1490495 RepID=A0A9W6TJS2_9STRA|nr:unnamed protein product [Phytophthora fragariaefolia]